MACRRASHLIVTLGADTFTIWPWLIQIFYIFYGVANHYVAQQFPARSRIINQEEGTKSWHWKLSKPQGEQLKISGLAEALELPIQR